MGFNSSQPVNIGDEFTTPEEATLTTLAAQAGERAAPFDPLASYVLGEHVWVGTQLKAAKSILTPGAYNAADWNDVGAGEPRSTFRGEYDGSGVYLANDVVWRSGVFYRAHADADGSVTPIPFAERKSGSGNWYRIGHDYGSQLTEVFGNNVSGTAGISGDGSITFFNSSLSQREIVSLTDNDGGVTATFRAEILNTVIEVGEPLRVTARFLRTNTSPNFVVSFGVADNTQTNRGARLIDINAGVDVAADDLGDITSSNVTVSTANIGGIDYCDISMDVTLNVALPGSNGMAVHVQPVVNTDGTATPDPSLQGYSYMEDLRWGHPDDFSSVASSGEFTAELSQAVTEQTALVTEVTAISGTTLLYNGNPTTSQMSVDAIRYYDVGAFRHVYIDMRIDDDSLATLDLGAGVMPAGGKIIDVTAALQNQTADTGTPIAVGRSSTGDNRFLINRANSIDVDIYYTLHLTITNPNPAPIVLTNIKATETISSAEIASKSGTAVAFANNVRNEIPFDDNKTYRGTGFTPNAATNRVTANIAMGAVAVEFFYAREAGSEDAVFQFERYNAADVLVETKGIYVEHNTSENGTLSREFNDVDAGDYFKVAGEPSGGDDAWTQHNFTPTQVSDDYVKRYLKCTQLPVSTVVNPEGLVPEALHRFTLVKTSGQTTVSTAYPAQEQLTWQAATVDTGLGVTGNTYVVPSDGTWKFKVAAETDQAGTMDGHNTIQITVNGTEVSRSGFATSGDNAGGPGSNDINYGQTDVEVDVVAGDVIEAHVSMLQGIGITPTQTTTYFQGSQLPTATVPMIDNGVEVVTDIQAGHIVRDMDGVRELWFDATIDNATNNFPVPFKTGTLPRVCGAVGGSNIDIGVGTVTATTYSGQAYGSAGAGGFINSASARVYVVGETP